MLPKPICRDKTYKLLFCRQIIPIEALHSGKCQLDFHTNPTTGLCLLVKSGNAAPWCLGYSSIYKVLEEYIHTLHTHAPNFICSFKLFNWMIPISFSFYFLFINLLFSRGIQTCTKHTNMSKFLLPTRPQHPKCQKEFSWTTTSYLSLTINMWRPRSKNIRSLI